MKTKNKYVNRSKISEAKFRQLVKLFSVDLNATQIAELSGLNRNTVNRYLLGIRVRIAEFCEETSPMSGQIEVDESYFGGRHAGKRGRGAAGKTIVFGLFKRNGKVYTEIVPNVKAKTLQSIIRGHVSIDSVIHSDKWRGYDGLVDVGFEKHFRVDHGKGEFVSGNSHINGIEGFWGYSKTRLTKFYGISKANFYLHLKECEFRFNYRSDDMLCPTKTSWFSILLARGICFRFWFLQRRWWAAVPRVKAKWTKIWLFLKKSSFRKMLAKIWSGRSWLQEPSNY